MFEDMKKVEKAVWRRAAVLDGLLDINIGMAFLALGVLGLFTFPYEDYILLPYFIIIISATIIIKRRYVLPRVGHIKFSKTRTNKRLIITAILTLSVIIGAVFYYLADRGMTISFMPVIMALNFLIVFSLMAYFLENQRLYLWAILSSISIFTIESINNTTGLTMLLLTGIITISTGVYHYIKYIRTHQAK